MKSVGIPGVEQTFSTRIRRVCLAVALLLVAGTADVAAQSNASAQWPLTNPANGGTGGGVTVAGQLIAAEQVLNNMEINQYTGTNASQRARMAGTGNTWPAHQTTQIDSVYMQFDVTGKMSVHTVIDSIVLHLGANSTSSMKANLYYSKDPTFTNRTNIPYTTSSTTSPAGTYLSTGALDLIDVATHVELEQGESLSLRIYPWVDNQSSPTTGKYVCAQDVSIFATVSPVAVPASVVWPLTRDEAPTISGLLAAGMETVSDSLELYGFTTADGVPCAWMVTKNHLWPAETSLNPLRYVEYAVTPQTGGTFIVDSIGMNLGAAYTNTLRATVVYSRSAGFENAGTIASAIVLPAGTLMPVSKSIVDTIQTGQTLYLRIYPYNTASEGWPTLMYVSDVCISGSTTGVAIAAPNVSTANATYVSTTFLTSGGTITADGGSPVSARGVCWNTSGNPTTSDNHTSDGTGTGAFVSSVTGLAPGMTYHLRAYATNFTGTTYGSEIVITTLAAIVVPTVMTTQISSIQVGTAIGGGNVTAWGGTDVLARGVCWDTIAAPTLGSNRTIDGSGLGSYTSGLIRLSGNTTYFVRAYATNSAGTAYGAQVSFTTPVRQPDTTVVVAQNGSGQYTTIQSAFLDVPLNYTGKWRILVRKGSYYEKDTLAAGKVNVILEGEDRDSTIITYDDYAGMYTSGTSGTFTISVDANDFVARNITFRNTYSPQPGVSGSQAVALKVNGDRQEYINCRILGYQDTYYTWGGSGTGRLYHKNCFIEGTVDFIFGRDIAVFDSCTIRSLRNGGTLTAASTDATSKYGYVFRNCTIVADQTGYDGVPNTAFYLGRPWQASPRTVFLRCSEPANLHPAGWLAWNVAPALYGEYRCSGSGSSAGGRVAWSSQLSDEEAVQYTLANIFAKNSANSNLIAYDWMPTSATAADAMPVVTSVDRGSREKTPSAWSLFQNYPNPFNPTTTIAFRISKQEAVTLKIFDMLGRQVAVLVDETKSPGDYAVQWDASKQPTGAYLYRLQLGEGRRTEKMILVK